MGIGEDGADLGRVTITDGWVGQTGVDRLGKSFKRLIVGRFWSGSEIKGQGRFGAD